MLSRIREKTYRLLRWSEKYTRTDMVYFAESNFWLTFGRIVATGSGVLLTLAFTNYLSPTAFGTYKYVLASAGFVGAFALGGLPPAAFQTIAQGNKNSIPAMFRIGILWSIPASIVTITVSAYYFFQGNSVLGSGFLFIAVANLFGGSLGITKVLFSATGDFGMAARYGLPRTLIPVALMILTVLTTDNIIAILFVYFASNLVSGLVLYYVSLRKLEIRDEPDESTPIAINLGKHYSIYAGVQSLVGQMDQLLMWHFVGPVQLAVYALALAPLKEVRMVADNLFTIIFSRFAAKEKAAVEQSVRLRTIQMFLVTLVAVTLYVLLAPVLFHVLFPQYVDAIFPSQILALTLLFQPRGVLEMFLVIHENAYKRHVAILGGQAIKLIALVVLIPMYGIMGAVFAALISEVAATIVLLIVHKWL